jgi:hypothetical protein
MACIRGDSSEPENEGPDQSAMSGNFPDIQVNPVLSGGGCIGISGAQRNRRNPAGAANNPKRNDADVL